LLALTIVYNSLSVKMSKSEIIDSEIESERVLIDEIMEKLILDEIHSIKSAFDGDEDIQEKCDTLVSVVVQGISLEVICCLRRQLQSELKHKQKLKPLLSKLRTAVSKVGTRLEEMRNPKVPLFPDRIIESELAKFPGSPWYALSFLHCDPKAGTTGSLGDPHMVYLRVPEKIAEDGEDLPYDWLFNKLGKIIQDSKKGFQLRLHSECHLGDICGQGRCDCGEQIQKALATIEENGLGAVFYLRQEGRGVNLTRKMALLEAEDGRDCGKWIGKKMPDEAFKLHGHKKPDLREFIFAGRIMRGIGLRKKDRIELITDNKKKIGAVVEKLGFSNVKKIEAAGAVITIHALVEHLEKLLYARHSYDLTANEKSLALLQRQMEKLLHKERIDDRLFDVLSLLYHVLLIYKPDPEIDRGRFNLLKELEKCARILQKKDCSEGDVISLVSALTEVNGKIM